jgi:hypothetical protein
MHHNHHCRAIFDGCCGRADINVPWPPSCWRPAAFSPAWHNTADRIVGTNFTWMIDWHLPNRSIWRGAWKAGLPMIAMRPHNGKVVLRYWLNGLGYATTEVDESWLRGNSFDYVVAPTGGTGAVSPASR